MFIFLIGIISNIRIQLSKGVIKTKFLNLKKLHGEYNKALKSVELVSVSDIKKMRETGTPFFLLVGRKTCLDCRDFLPLLVSENKSSKKKLYYLDVEKDLEKNRNYAKNNLKIEFLPTFLKFNKNGKIDKYNHSIENDTIGQEKIRIQEFLAKEEK